jgi:hypothetical protein
MACVGDNSVMQLGFYDQKSRLENVEKPKERLAALQWGVRCNRQSPDSPVEQGGIRICPALALVPGEDVAGEKALEGSWHRILDGVDHRAFNRGDIRDDDLLVVLK